MLSAGSYPAWQYVNEDAVIKGMCSTERRLICTAVYTAAFCRATASSPRLCAETALPELQQCCPPSGGMHLCPGLLKFRALDTNRMDFSLDHAAPQASLLHAAGSYVPPVPAFPTAAVQSIARTANVDTGQLPPKDRPWGLQRREEGKQRSPTGSNRLYGTSSISET